MNFIPKQISKFKLNPYIIYTVYPSLTNFEEDIFYTWNLKSEKLQKTFEYLIIPDTCIDIVLEEKNGMLVEPAISAPFSSPVKINLYGEFSYWGIRFKPGKIMKYICFELDTIKENFQNLDVNSESFSNLDDFMNHFTNYSPGFFNDKFLKFNYEPKKIIDSTLSNRHKTRLFELMTGFKINTYKKIQRFHSSFNDPYLHFYDMSHYIKTFKNLTSQTPKDFSKKFSI